MVIVYPTNMIISFLSRISLTFFFVFSLILCPISSLYASRSDNNSLKSSSKVSESKDTANRKKRGSALYNNSRSEKGNSTDSDEDSKGDKGSLKKETGLYDYNIPTAEEESYGWLIFKTILILAAIIAGFYLFFRFVTKKAGIPALGKGIIQILSIAPIGQNKFIQIVDLAGRLLVLGVSDSSINLIIEIEDRDEVDRIRLLCSKSSSMKSGGFQESLSKHLGRLIGKSFEPNKGKDEISRLIDDKDNTRLDYLVKQKERLKNLNSEG